MMRGKSFRQTIRGIKKVDIFIAKGRRFRDPLWCRHLEELRRYAFLPALHSLFIAPSQIGLVDEEIIVKDVL